MNQLQKLYDVSKEMERMLHQEVSPKDREAVIEQVNHLVEQRGALLNEIAPPYTVEEMQLGKMLVHLNKEIQAKMDTLFNELKIEMKQAKKQKKSNRTYINPYENVKSVDGVYMDSKK